MKVFSIRSVTILILLTITIFVLYIFNSEKFFSEYWLQRKYSGVKIERLQNEKLGNCTLSYKLVYNRDINIEVVLYSNGYVMLTTKKTDGLKQINSTTFISNPEKINKVISDFNAQYIESEINSVDDHLSQYYSVLTFSDCESFTNIQIAFYNVSPDERFLIIKNKVLEIAKQELKAITE